jgi:hypothetical protein
VLVEGGFLHTICVCSVCHVINWRRRQFMCTVASQEAEQDDEGEDEENVVTPGRGSGETIHLASSQLLPLLDHPLEHA